MLRPANFLVFLTFASVLGAIARNESGVEYWTTEDYSWSTPSPTRCLSEHYETHGFLTSPNYPDCYPNHVFCEWSLQAPVGQIVRLDFLGLYGLESSYDFLEIRDGPYFNSPLIGRLTGPNKPGVLRSSGRSMYVKFTSDGSIGDIGFDISYRYVQPGQDATLTMWPAAAIDEVDVKVQERENHNGDSTQICNSYYTSPPVAETTAPADFSPSPGECNEHHFGSSGYLTSPNYPDCYPNNVRCAWSLQAPAGRKVRLEFYYPYGLETGYDFLEVRDGSHSNSPLIGRFTGYNKPGWIYSSGGSMYISFISDSIIQDIGFDIYYSYILVGAKSNSTEWLNNTAGVESHEREQRISTTTPVCNPYSSPSTEVVPSDMTTPGSGECGEYHGGSYGFLTSPNYPWCYTNNAWCDWSLQAPLGQKVRLEFYDPFGLESCCDFIEVRDGLYSSSPLIGRFTGSSKPGILTSTGRGIYVRFTTDGSVVDVGFEIYYYFIVAGLGKETISNTTRIDEHRKLRADTGLNAVCNSWSDPTVETETPPVEGPTTQPPTAPPPFCPPTGVHTFPYPGNCTLYIKCFDGFEQVLSCAPLIFDKNDLVCKPEGEAVCDEEFPIRCQPIGYEAFPHSSSCSKYYECINGNSYESTCAVNTYFDATPDLLRCNQAELAVCNSECPETGIAFQAIRSSGCKWYKICISGSSANVECADGEVYSPVESKCVGADSYNCPYQ